jgi:hypothetical protein
MNEEVKSKKCGPDQGRIASETLSQAPPLAANGFLRFEFIPTGPLNPLTY